ncbi:flavin-dependent oxidoreductase [Actinosynnema sp. NPDC023587]|uniref:flavin-dependent oxidoreductase n=1 Tax=Actinosynnema sp. NPDC023587 TaxID=3154695 RepID=UPI0033CE87ED
MKVIVAGGGIGGLAAALSLHAAGITDVLVLEAVPEPAPLGVGINLLPHAVRELTELGLVDRVAAIGVETAELSYFTRFGQRIWTEPRGLAVGYRWPQYSVHRGRLQMLLLAAVRERLGPGAVRTGARVTGFTQTAGGVVVAAGGAELRCDVLVGADGINAATRALLAPDEGPPRWNGLVLWRGTTTMKPYLTGRSMIMAGDGVEKFVAYPISGPDDRGDVLVNWIAERPVDRAGARGDWNRRVDVADVLAHFGDWAFDWLDVAGTIRAAHAAFEYPMVDRDPLPRWRDGRVTLLGDAAHAMYPIGSNGASQAVLDARVLAHALATHGDVEEALDAYEDARRPPTTAILEANRRLGPEIVIKLAHDRAPGGFDDVDRVLPMAERAAIALRYKQTAGFAPELLNERASYSVLPVP